MHYQEIALPTAFKNQYAQMCGNDRARTLRGFVTSTGCGVLVTLDKTPHGELLHTSISHDDRCPTWEEIKDMKEHFFGDKTAIMVFPRKALYVNKHKNCFHLWQLPRIPGPSGDWEIA